MLDSIKRDLRQLKDDVDVFTTTDSNDAKRLFEEKGIDLIITDVLMPEKESKEIVRGVKQNYPTVKIIVKPDRWG